MQGLVLTSTNNLTNLLSAMRANGIPLLKVVSGWGAPWSNDTRRQVCALPSVIVRTVSGDGCDLDPNAVLQELAPWLTVRPGLAVELGNEPNAKDASDDAAWAFRWWFIETVNAVRARYPSAKIISPGLIENRQAEWWLICQDAFSAADSIGFHAYWFHQVDDTGQLTRALDQLGSIFPDKVWTLTEAGINDPATPAATKTARYGQLARDLPSQVAAECWYHVCADPLPGDADQTAYAIPESAFDELKAGGSV